MHCDTMKMNVFVPALLFFGAVSAIAATEPTVIVPPLSAVAKLPRSSIYLGDPPVMSYDTGEFRHDLSLSSVNTGVDSDGDGVPDFAQLDPGTKDSLRFISSNPRAPSRVTIPLRTQPDPTSYGPATGENARVGVAADERVPGSSAPDSLKWTIGDSNPLRGERSRVTDDNLEEQREVLEMRPILHLSIEMEKSPSSRRSFRIRVSEIESTDQPVSVWVSSDLQTWNKVEDSMIETGEGGDRRILVPLDSRMQFFRVTSP